MNTLDAPVYEVQQESKWYKDTMAYKAKQQAFFQTINETYQMDGNFVYWHSEYFGVKGGTNTYEQFKSELLKNPKDGIYPFKKRSKYFPVFKTMIETIGKHNPFKAHDVLGMNNMNSSQLVGGRWFYSVKDPKAVVGDEVAPIDYKEYLQVVMDALDKSEAND